MRWLRQRALRPAIIFGFLWASCAWGQTDCEAGNGLLDFAPPKTISLPEVIQKMGVAEAAAKEARRHYSFRQEVLMQTLSGKDVTGG